MTVGFVGIGNMGAALAGNVVRCGHDVVAFDAAGPERLPAGARFASSLDHLVRGCETVVLSLPDGAASTAVTQAIAATGDRRTAHVVDTSTIGVGAATAIAAQLAASGVGYVDAPVSGGVAGARARTLAVMYAGTAEACAAVDDVLRALTDRCHHVGDRPGMAQALKLLNNFLSATALAATSEAIAFASAAGLDVSTVLEVVNVSSGRSSATSDKFPNHVVPGTFASGFTNSLMAKDLRLYLDAVATSGTVDTIGAVTADVWRRFAEADPAVDITRIYAFVAGAGD